MPKTRQITAVEESKPQAVRVPPTKEEIALRAYQIYLERNGAPGSPLDDWTRAERELLEPQTKPKPRRKAVVKPIAA